MENPYKLLRKLTGESQKAFGAKYGFSRTAIHYIENGQYPDLSENMVNSMQQELADRGIDMAQSLEDAFGQRDLQACYHTWQSNERMVIAHRFKVTPTVEEGKHSPFHHFEVQIAANPTSFCQLLKIPNATAMRYAKGYTKTMPLVIEQALQEVQFPYIDDLKALMDDWDAD